MIDESSWSEMKLGLKGNETRVQIVTMDLVGDGSNWWVAYKWRLIEWFVTTSKETPPKNDETSSRGSLPPKKD